MFSISIYDLNVLVQFFSFQLCTLADTQKKEPENMTT